MPGSPATSPNYSIPRYSDSDTADFATQVNAITDGFDSKVARKTLYRAGSGVIAASVGDWVVAAASSTVNLPSGPSTNDIVDVEAENPTFGSSAVTITAPAGTVIHGRGLPNAGVQSILLGTRWAHVRLKFDGTNWRIVQGEHDTGWQALSLATGVANNYSGSSPYVAGAKWVGNRVELRGILHNTSGGLMGTGATIFTLPSQVAFPTATPMLTASCNGSAISLVWSNPVNGICSIAGGSFGTDEFLGLDGLWYSIE